MSLAERYSKLIAKRKLLEGDIDYDNEPVILEMIDLLTTDMKETVNFIHNECTEEQLIWMSEIFDEIVEKTNDPAFTKAVKTVASKYPDIVQKYNIQHFIDSAEALLK